jgi:hypothetical protein
MVRVARADGHLGLVAVRIDRDADEPDPDVDMPVARHRDPPSVPAFITVTEPSGSSVSMFVPASLTLTVTDFPVEARRLNEGAMGTPAHCQVTESTIGWRMSAATASLSSVLSSALIEPIPKITAAP